MSSGQPATASCSPRSARAPVARGPAWRSSPSSPAAGALALLLASLLAACDGELARPDASTGRDARAFDASSDAALADAAPTDAGAGPDPSCVVPHVGGDVRFAPDPPIAGSPFDVAVTDAVAHTNVALRLCTIDGVVDARFLDVRGSHTWTFGGPPLPPGPTQAIFVGDPDATVLATARVRVADGVPTDGGVRTDGGVDLCAWPAASLIDGRFDDGLDGLTPPGWQVRDPDAPGRCGDPREHVYAIDAPPGCGGRALAVDARGEWDCYAIQAFTDYDTIRGGRTYRLRATVRSIGRENPGGWFFLGLSWLDGDDRVFGDERNPRVEPLDFDWRRVELDVVAPPEARRAVVWLTAHYDGRVDFDSVALVER